MDGTRLREVSHLLHPANQMFVRRRRRGDDRADHDRFLGQDDGFAFHIRPYQVQRYQRKSTKVFETRPTMETKDRCYFERCDCRAEAFSTRSFFCCDLDIAKTETRDTDRKSTRLNSSY